MARLASAAAAYTARPAKSKRMMHLPLSLSSLAKTHEPDSSSGEEKPSFPKHWARDQPGKINVLGEVVRSGSPMRLSSYRRSTLPPSFISSTFHRLRNKRLRSFSDLAYYCLLMSPIIALLVIVVPYLLSSETVAKAPKISEAALSSAASDPELLRALKEQLAFTNELNQRVVHLEHARKNDMAMIETLKAELKQQQGSSVSHAAVLTRKEFNNVVATLQSSRSELAASIATLVFRLDAAEKKASGGGNLGDTENMIGRMLYKFLADGTGLVDYALEATGGSVTAVSSIYSGLTDSLGFLSRYLRRSEKPQEMIRPSVVLGHCWPMIGHSGWAIISLSESIYPEAISVEHVAPEIAPHFESAPKGFSLSAIVERDHRQSQIPLGNWNYSKPIPGEVSPIQTFKIMNQSHPTSAINFTVNSNYGGNYTCVYRVRIHGRLHQD